MLAEFFNRLHTVIDVGKQLVDDKTASIAPELFDHMSYAEKEPDAEIPLIKAGTRINWNGILKKAAVDLWDIEGNNPDNAPTLWENIQYRKGIRIIPEIITATLAFKKDELGWWGDIIYRSKVNGNVYTPDVYPDNWEVIDSV